MVFFTVKARRVLLIGHPISYALVDINYLGRKGLNIFFLHTSNGQDLPENEKNIFIDQLDEKLVQKIVFEYGIEQITCFNDNFLLETANIRTSLKLKGISKTKMRDFKFKSTMTDKLKNVIDTIPYVYFKPDLEYETLNTKLGHFPYFLKPDCLAGSEGTHQILNENDFEVLKAESKNIGYTSIIQPYINEELYHCELMVHSGSVIYAHARRYSYPNHMILNGKIISSMPIEDYDIEQKIIDSAVIVQKELAFNDGVMHTEFFINKKNEIIFLETNIRQAGGGINLIHKKRLGISLETAMILLESGQSLDISIKANKYYTCGYIPLKKGKVIGFDLPILKGKVKFQERVKIGQICKNPKSASDVAMSYFGEYLSIQDIKDDFDVIERYNTVLYD